MRVVLISTYELGRQPFGLASPAAWLRASGHEVTMADVSCAPMPRVEVEQADLIAFFLPMHTATKLSLRLLDRVRQVNPEAHLCAYGLYAPLNERLLREAGVGTILGGEFESGLVELTSRLSARGRHPLGRAAEPAGNGGARLISLDRQQFRVPDRTGLPPLGAYAQLVVGRTTRRVGYTEASRGCKHLCRHCPVVPVYRGTFRVVQAEVVLEDIRRQVAAGAEHITFGDPDFFNGPGHAVPIVRALHEEWPWLSYDVTIKVEHLLQHAELLTLLRDTGCAFVISAVESLDDAVLERLAKGHTRADFLKALGLMRRAALPMSPTFIPFTPWTTMAGYREFLRGLAGLGLAEQVAPIQLAIRLLIPAGSLMLDLDEVRRMIGPFDSRGLCYPWRNADPAVDALCTDMQVLIKAEEKRRAGRGEVFRKIWDLAQAGEFPVDTPMASRATIPYLTEPWYC
ncbi:MAG TPA: CUAEP/CCAEP-tail radical SAM protein [Candidatus Acidoferrales bacterium]|nr:CUAEP/CCAEP-tail radical SAM protein [Candidatus Acidoferrales bacterium]